MSGMFRSQIKHTGNDQAICWTPNHLSALSLNVYAFNSYHYANSVGFDVRNLIEFARSKFGEVFERLLDKYPIESE